MPVSIDSISALTSRLSRSNVRSGVSRMVRHSRSCPARRSSRWGRSVAGTGLGLPPPLSACVVSRASAPGVGPGRPTSRRGGAAGPTTGQVDRPRASPPEPAPVPGPPQRPQARITKVGLVEAFVGRFAWSLLILCRPRPVLAPRQALPARRAATTLRSEDPPVRVRVPLNLGVRQGAGGVVHAYEEGNGFTGLGAHRRWGAGIQVSL